jgi:hypothetical protein
MKTQNITLRPYHNPENIDESLVPDGWRFRYADEIKARPRLSALDLLGEWLPSCKYTGAHHAITYIVPVNP